MSIPEGGWRGVVSRYPSSTYFLAYISVAVTILFILQVVETW